MNSRPEYTHTRFEPKGTIFSGCAGHFAKQSWRKGDEGSSFDRVYQ